MFDLLDRRYRSISLCRTLSLCQSLHPVAVLPTVILTTFAICAAPNAAYADVVGRLHFVVTAQTDGKPVAGAKITLHDSTGVRPDVSLTTDTDGTVTSGQLDNHAWHVAINIPTYQIDERDVTVVADTTTDVLVVLSPVQTGTITVRANRNLVRSDKTASSTARSDTFYQTYPVTAGNEQSLSKALTANPGFVQDSANQAHPRGEHASTSIYINGFLLPGALQGRAGQFLSPTAIQTLDIQTGGYAPEYGGETAAVLNLTPKAGTIKPFTELKLGGGSFGTFQGNLTFGGQAGAPQSSGSDAKKFGYLVNLTQYSTNNALEPPQPDKQTAHNGQSSTTAFGNFSYQATERDQFSLLINTAPARTEIANRTGLPSKFAGLGQGFGYGGAQDAGSTAVDAAGNTIPLLSQQDSGQDIYQKDSNTFAALQWRKEFSDKTNGFFTIGYADSRQDILNNNPNNGLDVSSRTLPQDSSLEFSPTITRHYKQTEVQGNITVVANPKHTIKYGAQYQDQQGDESYLLIPGSQYALDALAAIDPRFAPGGGTVQTDASGNPILDSLGNPIFTVSASTATPTLKVKRSGYYAAGYAQDTFKVTRRFTVNYGLRVDSYKQTQNLGQAEVKETELSPRINTAYVVAPLTILRLSYNKLFTQPPLAQGAVIGESIKPQRSDLWEQSVERQIGQTQTVKLAFYQKYSTNEIDTGLLVPGTQIGVFSAVNFDRSHVRGTELSYDLSPRGGQGVGGFLAISNSTAKPGGLDNTGAPVDAYNDHDQLWTVSTGAAYTLHSGASAGLSYYFGSGVESSKITEDSKRQPHSEVDLRLASGDKVFKGIGAELTVANLFDSRELINYNSGFSGTRFQQGRRVLFSLSEKF